MQHQLQRSHKQGWHWQYKTVRSEFAYYVPRSLNRTVPAYLISVQCLKRTAPMCHTCTIAKKAYRTSMLEMATAQRTRPRAVVGARRRAAWQLKSVLRHSVSAAPRTIIFLHFFTIIAGDFLSMNNNG